MSKHRKNIMIAPDIKKAVLKHSEKQRRSFSAMLEVMAIEYDKNNPLKK